MNPFWSEKLQEELDLRDLRPTNLPPVPGDDAEIERELDGEMELPISDQEGSRRKVRGRSRDPGAGRLMEEGFETPATPASWMRHGKDVTPTGQSGGEVGRRSEGEMPYVEKDQEQSLERALERELMSQLHGENQRLKKELEEMQLRQRVQSSRVTPSSWSAVTPEDDGGIPAPPPPRSRSPMPRNHDGRGDGLKYTPNGTRVPDGPPPGPSVLPDFPVWPFGNYETSAAWAPCLMSMGSCWKGPLQAGDQRGGMQSRQELQGGYKDLGHGVQSRQEHQDRFQGSRDGMDSRHGQGGCAGLHEGGIQSRHGVPHQDVMSAAQARAAWLERELKSLKEVLETDARNNGMQQSGYWSNPVWRWDQEDRGSDRAKQRDADLRHGRAQQRDADPREARAVSNDGVCGDGRAPGVSQGEGQTTEVSHHGRDRGHQQLDGRDLCDPGERKGSAGPSNEKENEALRSSNPVLPILPAVSQKNSAVDAADWLVEIRPMIGDLSTSAADWWNSTMQSTLEVYKVWLASTPLERLRLKPPNPVDSTKFRNGHQIQRLEQRVTTILLPSIPLELRHDLISARQLWPSAILYRILRSYQPGGWGERSMLLTELTVTSAASSAIDASTRLRMWRRHRSRAIELGASLPDVLLQVRALDVIVQGVLKQHPQSQFRVASYRMEANIDERPTDETLAQFLELLTAEMDTLQTGTTEASGMGGEKSGPSVKMIKASGGAPCKFWGSEQGCLKGKKCSYLHDWQSLEDRSARCFVCSSLQHRKSDCPVRSSAEGSTAEGGSGQGRGNGSQKGYGKGEGKSKNGKDQTKGKDKGGKSKGKGDQQIPDPPSTKSMTTPMDGLNETGKGQGEGQDKDENAGRKENNSDGGTGSIEAATLMSEVSSLLKSMRSGVKPQINAVRLQRLDTTGQKTVLLDGGATHCLRPAKNEQEWLKSIETPVFLASGTVTLRQVPGSETLVTQDKNTQPIVPLAALTQMGIQITWDEKGCEMKRSDGSKLPVFLDSGCPVMERIQGMELMAEVEHFNRQKTGIRQVIAARRLEASNGLCSDGQAKKALEIATLFPQVPAHLAAEIPGDETIDMSKKPLNRRQRKRIAESKSLTIHLFSGPQTSLWTCCESEGHVVLCVEIQKGLDLHNSALVAYLESLFRSGRVDLLLAGPPCRTVSLQRFRDDDGPPPVRGRDGLMRFGLPFNTFPNKQLCDQDSLLWLRLLWFSHIGVQANVEMEIGIEQPADPEGYLPPTRQRPRYGFPSFLSWPETFVIGETCSLRRIGFDQGRFGHPHKKPTEMLTNIPELYRLQDLRMEIGQGRAWAEELEKRLKQSKAAAAWAPGLVRLLQEVIKRKQDAVEEHGRRVTRQVESETRPPWIDREVGPATDRDSSMESRDPPGMRALTAADLHDWRQHVANEHQPARRDCSVCLQNMGRDRPHKRITHPSSYCIAGPFKGGKDQLETLPRYMAVGVFTVPVKNGTPLAEKLREFGKKVESKEDPELQGDPDLIWGEPEKEDEIDPFASVEAAEEVVLSEAEIQQCEARNQEWREKIQDLQDVQVCSLTLAAPLRSRHATEVQKVLTFFYCKLRAIGLPVVRVHTDRAKEFVSRSLAQWMRDHDVLHTTSSGDESQGSARAEGEIGYLKSRVRLLINASKSPPHYWPLALRHAAEARYRQQMSQFGVPLPRLIPFGTQAMAKFKRWHHVKDKDTWEHPMQRVTVYGPAMDMSSSSRGYYIEANGRWMRSTVVLETKNPRGGALPVENLQRELQDQGEQLEDLAMDNGSEQYAPTTIAPEEDFEDILEGDEGRALPRIVHVDDQPHQGNIKRRLMGKQSPPAAYSQPLLRVLRSGGECTIQEVMDAMDFEDEKENHPEEEDFNWGENRSSTMQEWYEEEGWRWDQGHHRSMADLHHSVQAVELLQQSEMRKLCKEEIGKMDQVTHGKIVLKLEGECEELEKRLMKMQMEEKEVFTSRTVPLEEVRQNLEEWIPSLQSEYQSLLTHEAIKPISQEEYQELHQEMEVTTIPGMVVSVVKPPYKLKSRFVACGNYVQIDPQQVPETAAGGLDAIVARVMVAMAARNEWAICTADVRTAFLQAERRPTPGKVTIVTPPGLLKETGILQKGAKERWLIQKAIYGLIESPKDWADHRDAILKKVKWIDRNTKKQKWIERTAENHLWQVKVKDQQEPEGFLGVYVDDLIAIGKDGLLDELMEQLTMVFKMAEPTKVTPEKGVTFCGYEIGMDENYNYTISQEKYVEELIKKHQMEGFEAQPLPKVTEAEDEDPIEKKTLRSAQTIAGELLWLMTRSRPDICYAVSLMTRLLHRRPSYVVELGRHVLRYLAESKSMGLKFESGKRGSEELLVKTDTSFAPPVDGYRSVQGTAIFHGDHLLQWSSGRQAFVTLSTAEAELVGYVDGFQQGQSIDGLLKIFGFYTYKRLQGDCKAALAQINSDATAWRTRHLRLRAARLRELVLDRESSWEAEHIPGLELAPDGFTKVLVGQAFRRHREQLGMCNVEHFKEKIEVEEAQIRRLWYQEEVEETESLKLSQCLLGAGIAMVCTDHKVLGAMLLATAGLLSVKGRWEQENKRPARKVSRPQQELRERANTPNGSKDEAAHPPIGGITGMAHDVRGDLRDQSRIGANVGSQGFRASRMSSLFSCHGSEVEEQPTAEERLPRLCAFRAPGDPSRDQLPLRPPVDAARAKAREQARSFGTAHRELYRNFDIPQPHHDRQRAWWDDARFEAGPTGQDKWIQTRDGLLIRTHSKLRRRSFHPLHRSVPIEISGLRAERHTVIFADDPESLFVDPRPRFVESDEWSGNTTWTKDYRWRGYTVFVLRSCVADRHEQGQPDYVDPVLAAPKRASRPAGERLPDPRDDDRSGGAAPMFAAASSSSAGGYGSNQREREPAMVQVNVNVYNTSGIATPRAEVPEAEDSEFEFVTP